MIRVGGAKGGARDDPSTFEARDNFNAVSSASLALSVLSDAGRLPRASYYFLPFTTAA